MQFACPVLDTGRDEGNDADGFFSSTFHWTRMLEAKYIRENIDEVRERIGRRGQAVDLDQFL